MIVDDSDSMREHWGDMTQLLGIIAYMIKPYDADGLDLYFASSKSKHHEKKSSKLVNILEQRSRRKGVWGDTNMSILLEEVLSGYGNKIRRERILHAKTRPLNVYIFTDANWTRQCDIVPPIDKMVKTLVQHGLPENQVGLQFISFGNDPESLRRLTLVDNYLVSMPTIPL